MEEAKKEELKKEAPKKEKAKKGPELIVSISPHIKSEETTRRIMWSVSIALLPAALMGVYYFGPRAAIIIFLSIISALLSEYIFQRSLKKKVTINDGSAFLTGLLIAMNLPPSVPFYIPVLGTFVAIIITKQLFGGLGFNIFNPALMGRAFLLISFPKLMTVWSAPDAGIVKFDTVTTATPLGILKEEGLPKLVEMFGDKINLYNQLLIGHRAGCIGETCSVLLILGALFLLFKGYISWHIPVSYLGTAALLAWIFGTKGTLFAGDPLVHLLSGGILLGALFMATDYVTSPSVKRGQILCGICCGFLTMLIRLKGGYPEGVQFSILIMNCFTPLIDRWFKPKVFGTVGSGEIKK